MARLEERSKYREHLVKLAKDSVVERAAKLYLAQYRPQLDHLNEGDQVPSTVPIGKERFVAWVENVITNFFPEVHGVTENEKILKEYAVQIADTIAKSDTKIQNPLRDYVVSKDPIFIRANQKVYIKRAAEDAFVPSGSLKTPNLYSAPQEHSRYCPDHPGAMLRRVSDNKYHCPITSELSGTEPWKAKFSYDKGHEVNFDMGVHNQTSFGPSNAHPILPFLFSGSASDSDAHKAKSKDYDFDNLYSVTSEFPARQEKKKASILLRKIMKIAEDECEECPFEEVEEDDESCDCASKCDCKDECTCEDKCTCKAKKKASKFAQQVATLSPQNDQQIAQQSQDDQAKKDWNANPAAQLKWYSDQLKADEQKLQDPSNQEDKEVLKERITALKSYIKEIQEKTQKQSSVKVAQQLFAPTTMVSRQCPDHPGQQLQRTADNERKCPLDGRLYDFTRGFTTEDGKQHLGGSVQNQGAIPIGSSLIVNKKASIKTAETPLTHEFLFGLLQHLPATAEHERRVLNYKFQKGVDLEQALQAIKQADELATQQAQLKAPVASLKSFTKQAQVYTKQDFKQDIYAELLTDVASFVEGSSSPEAEELAYQSWENNIYNGELPDAALELLEKADKLFGIEEASDIVKEVVGMCKHVVLNG